MSTGYRLLKDGRTRSWYFRVDLPAGPDGRRRQHQQGGFRLKREAEAAEAAFLQGQAQTRPSDVLYGEHLQAWLSLVQTTLAPNTHRTYEALTRHHVQPALGATPLGELRAPVLRAFLHGLPLAPASRELVRAILQGSLRQAVRDELLERNPAVGLDLPRNNVPDVPPPVPTPAGVRELVRRASASWLKVPVFLGIGTGMGRGEVLGLRWEDVDLEKGVLQVRQQVTEVGKVISVARLKRPSRRRAIQLAPFLVELLTEHLEAWEQTRTAAGTAWQSPGHVVCNDNGTLISPHRLTAHFEKLRNACGLPQVSFHKLRHLAATLLLEAHIPTKVVSEFMGHSSEAITSEVYQHVTPSLQREAALVLDRALREAARTERHQEMESRGKRRVLIRGRAADSCLRENGRNGKKGPEETKS